MIIMANGVRYSVRLVGEVLIASFAAVALVLSLLVLILNARYLRTTPASTAQISG